MNRFILQYIKGKYNNDDLDQKIQYYKRIKKYPKSGQAQFKNLLKSIENAVECFLITNPKTLPKRMATFNALGNVIINDSRQFSSEALIQHELYSKLKQHFKIIPELKVEDCIFDLAILDENNRLISIIEVKRTEQLANKFLTSAQFDKYSKFNIPIFTVANCDDFTVQKILQELNHIYN